MKYLSQIKTKTIKGKTCLLRVDYNVQNLKETHRLETSLPTLKFLIQHGVKVVILSHRGRPTKRRFSPIKRGLTPIIKNGRRNEFTLKIAKPFLEKKLKRKITFFSNFDFKNIREKIKPAPPGSIFLLENLRFLDGEEENSRELGEKLTALGDFYVNDAFATSHRKNASLTQLPKFLPSYAGLLLEKEIKTLTQVMRSPKKPLLLILGGAKVSDKAGVIKFFLKKADTFLLGGLTAVTFLKAKGLDIGETPFEEKMIRESKRLLKSSKIILPIDYVMANDKIMDIGPATENIFENNIGRAKTIIWSGPLGKFEDKRFRKGSEAVAEAIAKSKAFSLIGGGETVQLFLELKLDKKVGFLSTGGGAMLEFLAGKKLPGIEALR